MLNNFIATYKRLLRSTNFATHRYIYPSFNINSRITGLIGPRGTGKTTLLLQFIKEKMDNQDICLYVSLDHIYFSNNKLLDFVNDLYELYGVRYFFLDEVHKYPTWEQEFKNIYDSYPDVKIVFSGSSSIDLIKGIYDLSRRGVIYRMGGLSFREYLWFNGIAQTEPIAFAALLAEKSKYEEKIGAIERIRGHFKEYLTHGYYPFALEDKAKYHQKLLNIIEKTVFEDISNFYNLKTENLPYFKRILAFVATIPPGELNKNSIAKNIGLDNKTVENFLHILHETGLIELVASDKSGSQLLRQTEKIFLDNPDMYHAIIEEIGYECSTGSIREIFFIKMIKNAQKKIYFSRAGDFIVDDTIFEIGGKNKSLQQIKHNLDNAYLVKDDITYGNKFEIPLYLFGFLY
jgi:hypothetical protein